MQQSSSESDDKMESDDEMIDALNTASASKVGKFRPFWGEVKKTKRSADEYFHIQECRSTTLETTLDAFCERSFNLLDATRRYKSGPCR